MELGSGLRHWVSEDGFERIFLPLGSVSLLDASSTWSYMGGTFGVVWCMISACAV